MKRKLQIIRTFYRKLFFFIANSAQKLHFVYNLMSFYPCYDIYKCENDPSVIYHASVR